jgi:hypothetical protein
MFKVYLFRNGRRISEKHEPFTVASLNGAVAVFPEVGEKTKDGKIKLIRIDAVQVVEVGRRVKRLFPVCHPGATFHVFSGAGVTVRFEAMSGNQPRISERNKDALDDIKKYQATIRKARTPAARRTTSSKRLVG